MGTSPVSGGFLAKGWVRILAAAGVLTLALMSVGAVISHPATAKSPGSPKQVELVSPEGTPLNVSANGSLSTTAIQYAGPGTPIHLQDTFSPAEGSTTNYDLVTAIPPAATVSISSITMTCLNCISESVAAEATIFSLDSSDCAAGPSPSGPANGTVAQLWTNGSEPTTEFTYPTARLAPAGFTPSGTWCLGVTVLTGDSSGFPPQAFITIDGDQD
jgi:hypothetical protein